MAAIKRVSNPDNDNVAAVSAVQNETAEVEN